MKICVFCASGQSVPSHYHERMRELGLAMGRRGHDLVFGGYDTGLMGTVAHSVRDAEGKVYGVVAADVSSFAARNFFDADELIEADNITARKDIMKDLADAYITGPGSFGTLDEVFEVLVEQKLGTDRPKPVAFFNAGGYYDVLIDKVQSMVSDGFMPTSDLDLFFIEDDVEAMLDELEKRATR